MMTDIDNDENENFIDDTEEAKTGMEEIDRFDFERAAMLMGILEKVANIGVKATSIGGLAAAALNEMNEEAKEIGKKRAAVFADLERKRAEAIEAQRRAQEEADAETVEAERPRAIPSTHYERPDPTPGQPAARAPVQPTQADAAQRRV